MTLGHSVLNFSGCRELNSVYTHPKRAYYRYTTPRKNLRTPKHMYYRYTTARYLGVYDKFQFLTIGCKINNAKQMNKKHLSKFICPGGE